MKRILLLIISLMMLALPVSAADHIADNADLIAEATEAQIERANQTLADKNGASIHIYTAETCDGDVAEFAHGLFNSYDLDGRAVLLCVFRDDYYLVRGAELEKVLPENELAPLLEEHLEPDFAEGLTDSGVRKLTAELASILNEVKKVDTASLERTVFIIFIALVAIALLLTVLLFIMRIVGSRKNRLRRRRRRPNKR